MKKWLLTELIDFRNESEDVKLWHKRKTIWRSDLCPWERHLVFHSMHSQSQKLGSTKKSLLIAIFPIIHLHNPCPFLIPRLFVHSWVVLWFEVSNSFLKSLIIILRQSFQPVIQSLKSTSSHRLFGRWVETSCLSDTFQCWWCQPCPFIFSLCLPSCCSFYARCSWWITFRLLLNTCVTCLTYESWKDKV